MGRRETARGLWGWKGVEYLGTVQPGILEDCRWVFQIAGELTNNILEQPGQNGSKMNLTRIGVTLKCLEGT